MPAKHRDLFHESRPPEILDYISERLIAGDLLPEEALAMFGVIHEALCRGDLADRHIYQRYSAIMQSLNIAMPEVYKFVVSEWSKRGGCASIGEEFWKRPYENIKGNKIEVRTISRSDVKQHPLIARGGVVYRAGKYLISRALMIAVAIFVGIFVTVLIANKSGQVENNINSQINFYISNQTYAGRWLNLSDQERSQLADQTRLQMQNEAGLNLPFWQRHILWTIKALQFDWGDVTAVVRPFYTGMRTDLSVRGIILQYFPNTLLLVGASYFLIFIIGIPLALYLSGHYGNWLDKLASMLIPLSSVPAWVHAIILISIFAAELRLLPVSGMFDTLPPDTPIGYVPIVLRHMVLPVTAIFLGVFFQLVSSWRTYFIIFAGEDYVELAKAKGLPDRELEQHYILKPALPYVITSFALTLIGFWQMTVALEVVFQWPGIGWLYITKALPNFWGESMYKGDLLVAIGIVVIFAYLLGAIVFSLDVLYMLIDPRVSFANSGQTVQAAHPVKLGGFGFWHAKDAWLAGIKRKRDLQFTIDRARIRLAPEKVFSDFLYSLKTFVEDTGNSLRTFSTEVRRYPSAMVGLFVIVVLVIGSIYAVVALPYKQIGNLWSREVLVGRPYIPRLAEPAWTNWFRIKPLLSTFIKDSQDKSVSKSIQYLPGGLTEVIYDFPFDYSYADFPQELHLFLDANYLKKRPNVSLTWITPDGRHFDLSGVSVDIPKEYDFEQRIPVSQIIAGNAHWQKWFKISQTYPTPAHYLLFADPNADGPVPLNGKYHLKVTTLFFENGGYLHAQLVLLGQVYGAAGTDYLRRDLIVPLLWGLPFALLVGLGGAFVTTVVSMLVAASGVWFGGWVDNLIQRLSDITMIMPVLAISVLAYALFQINLWLILAVIILLNILGSPAKTFRSAFLQIKDAPYIEAAQAYGASNLRIIFQYLVPKIVPVMIPQLIILIPSFVFLEATLGLFNIKSEFPTWGTVIYQGLANGALYGSRYWVLEPLALLLLTGVSFAMVGFALERILNPRLLEKSS